MLGDAASYTQLNYLAGKHWVNNNYGFYFNDNWHILPQLTLNLGLRFDGMPHAYERYNQFGNFNPANYNSSLGSPLNADGTLNPASLTTFNGTPFYLNGIREAGINGFPRGVVQNDYKTVQPRVGFAYDVNGDGKTVVRGGFGMFFERVQGNDVYNAALNPPFAYQPSANNVYFSDPHTSANTGATTNQSFPSTLTNLSYYYPNPGTAMFSFGMQRQVAASMVAVLQYAGSPGWHQSAARQINTLPLTATNAAAPNNMYYDRQGVANGSLNANSYRQYLGYSGINQEETTTNFSYNSLQAGLRIEARRGLTLGLAYTYSHEIDEVSYDLNGLSDPFNAAYDRGSGALDRRHNFNANYIYNLPFFTHSSNAFERTTLGGWSYSGIAVAETGTPQYITYNGPDTLGLGGGTTNRPNLVGKVHYSKANLQWVNPNAFASPVAPWVDPTNNNQGFGSAGKDAVILPGQFNFNMSLFKSIEFKPEGPTLQLRFESFNTFNHTQFNGIDAGATDPNFGQLTSVYDGRRLQLGAKFNF